MEEDYHKINVDMLGKFEQNISIIKKILASIKNTLINFEVEASHLYGELYEEENKNKTIRENADRYKSVIKIKDDKNIIEIYNNYLIVAINMIKMVLSTIDIFHKDNIIKTNTDNYLQHTYCISYFVSKNKCIVDYPLCCLDTIKIIEENNKFQINYGIKNNREAYVFSMLKNGDDIKQVYINNLNECRILENHIEKNIKLIESTISYTTNIKKILTDN